uniref:Uncharacterized protein n=1 Tax=Chromera velia CCMP2878 TaxID=1169474 RepID=A0A0G4F4B2_9ALVE|eukprot:Cvel_2737.t1-p1 / transcript=Cvel_2737.t1 / gene=Cvel_2737 / organism=Chromera_velia_CCMP2878 / gene_product=hypothetical protein / transcript_product=hypothetical protein / location=Cvel_scaffold109:117497-122438(-) / protein_length=810 / sequence_SO=supercontig / SO=protein_coding / is_pseudo=false
MNGGTNAPLEEPQGGKSGEQIVPCCAVQETEAQAEGSLCVLLQHLALTSQIRDLGKVQASPPVSIDLSEESISPLEAPPVFPLLLPLVKVLCLRGNSLRAGGIEALAEVIMLGKASGLKSLDLENTELDEECLKPLCTAIAETPLRVETLNLSENHFGDSGIAVLCPVLCTASLPCAREIFLRNCRIAGKGMERIAARMEKGDLGCLETLALDDDLVNWPGARWGKGLTSLGGALRIQSVPAFRLLCFSSLHESPQNMAVFLDSLTTAERPPSMRVDLSLYAGTVDEERLRALVNGKYPAIRQLNLFFSREGSRAGTFFGALMKTSESLQFERLGLQFLEWVLEEVGNEALRLLTESVLKGRCRAVNKLVIKAKGQVIETQLSDHEKAVFLPAVVHTNLPLLCHLDLRMHLTDAEIALLADSVRAGRLTGLQNLTLQDNRGMTGEGMGTLMGALMEGQEGLPSLEVLNLARTRAGEGAGVLGGALEAGKLPKLSEINLTESGLTDEGVSGLAAAVRTGALVGSAFLRLSRNENVGKGAGEDFMSAVAERADGLPKLRWLHFPSEAAAGAGKSVIPVLVSGKLISLQSVDSCQKRAVAVETTRSIIDFYQVRSEIPSDSPVLYRAGDEGLLALGEGIRAGRFPSRLFHLCLCLEEGGRRVYGGPLLSGITQSESGLPGLKSLFLNKGRLDAGALRTLAAGKLPHLRELSFIDSNIDDEGMRALGGVFGASNFSELWSVSLSDNRIGIEGASAFFDALHPSSLPNLRRLNIGEQKTYEGKEKKEAFQFSVHEACNLGLAERKLCKLISESLF